MQTADLTAISWCRGNKVQTTEMPGHTPGGGSMAGGSVVGCVLLGCRLCIQPVELSVCDQRPVQGEGPQQEGQARPAGQPEQAQARLAYGC